MDLPEGSLSVHGKDVVIAYDDFADARRAFTILEAALSPSPTGGEAGADWQRGVLVKDIPESEKPYHGLTPPKAHPAPLEVEAAWHPIETAPHNRSVLLGWKDWRDGHWCMEVGPASWGTRVGAASNMSGHGSATHWMPLPVSPALTKLQEGGR